VASCSAKPTSVYAGSGDRVAVHVTASDPDNDNRPTATAQPVEPWKARADARSTPADSMRLP
jgi:hypothetical protein